jgi:hypothetical protein
MEWDRMADQVASGFARQATQRMSVDCCEPTAACDISCDILSARDENGGEQTKADESQRRREVAEPLVVIAETPRIQRLSERIRKTPTLSANLLRSRLSSARASAGWRR